MNSIVEINRPFFSIIIATLNADKYLEESINSILSQSNKSWELIIIDGVSNDSTIDIIKKYNSHISYFESSNDQGIYDAWNKALKHVKGNWLYFLGADDYFYNNDVLKNTELILSEKSPKLQYKIAYGTVISFDKEKNYQNKSNIKKWEEIKRKFFQVNCIHHQGVFHHREYFNTYGIFDSSFKIAGDYELLLRGLKKEKPLQFNLIISYARLLGISTDLTNSKKTLLEFKKAGIKNNINQIKWIWYWDYFKVIIKSSIGHIFGKRIIDKVISYYRNV